jgi:hypothetical protein
MKLRGAAIACSPTIRNQWRRPLSGKLGGDAERLRYGEVLGLINWTTRKRVNYLRTDVIGAFRRVDLVAVTLLAIATAMLWGHDGLPELAILVMLYVQTVLFIRARRTDARMNELMEQHPRTRAGCGR